MLCRIFNIGNTHVQIADLEADGTLRLSASAETSSFDPEKYRTPSMAAASVVPSLESAMQSLGAFLISPLHARGPVDLSLMENPSTLGADRLANAAELIFSGSLPALCADFGTAITLELVDEKGRMRGGAILPGRALLRRTLHDHTAKLPLTALRADHTVFPGNCTRDAIDIGCDTGAVGAVREILAEAEKKHPGIRKIACGGDAPFFLKFLNGFELADDLFTLRGIAGIWKRSQQANV